MDKSINNKNNLIDITSKKLNEYVDNPLNFSLDDSMFNNENTNPKTFSNVSYIGKSLRRLPISNCIFNNCDFTSVSFSGCKIINSKFIDCNFNSSSMQNCDINNVIINSGKSNSYPSFRNSYLEKVNFPEGVYDSNFNNAYMLDCTFRKEIKSCNLENAVFDCCHLNDVVVLETTIEYATFKNVHSENLSLPFAQIPYIYNGLSYVLNGNDNVIIRTSKFKNDICAKEYKSLLPDLEKYYISSNKYFPLINIYITINDFENAFNAIINGLKYYFQTSNFREITNICKIIKLCNFFSYKHREQIHNAVVNYAQSNIDTNSKRYYYNFYYPEITSLLLYEINDYVKVEFQIQTKIKEGEYDKIAFIYKTIDEYVSTFLLPTEVSHIEISHNSDILMKLAMLVDPALVPIYIPAIYFILSKGKVILDALSITGNISNSVSNIKSIKKDIIDMKYMNERTKLEIGLKEATLEEKKNNIKLQELEIQEKQKRKEISDKEYAQFIEQKRMEFAQSDILIEQISHNTISTTETKYSSDISSYVYVNQEIHNND